MLRTPVALIALALFAACGGSAKPAPSGPVLENNAGSIGEPAPTRVEQARVIARTATGGEIDLTSPGGAALEEAKEHMERHCGAKQYILNEMQRRDTGRQITVDGEQVPEQVWRLLYACTVAP